MNWFKRKSQKLIDELFDRESPRRNVRYRATFPIDVWVEDTGDIEEGREQAYEILKSSLDYGLERNSQYGYNYDLYLSDLKTDSEVFSS